MPGYDQHRNNRYQLFATTFSRIPLYLFLIKTAATFYIQFSGPIALSTRTGLFHWGLILIFGSLVVHVIYYLPFYRPYANCIYASFFVARYSLFSLILPNSPVFSLILPYLRFFFSPSSLSCLHCNF
jgi:hypothetical protein